ncbi:helix-turn-helix domain-containing protein [Nocardiopsis eucommiae]|uniref:Helix-turn-helix domain-containing protein n=1 Tax=Nocardiopsis eucommiae TaxID=2831970 RepID=A0A975L7Z3_9ACTN|nr:helix-turn-helix domain-containing protein [Nocardiopsis eucommiae]
MSSQATRDYQNRRSRLIAYGQWKPTIDTAPVRVHIQSLRGRGLSAVRIAALAGVHPNTVKATLHRTGPTMSRRVGTAILAVTHDPNPTATKVAVRGTTNRVRCLAALGWSSADIADASGVSRSAVGRYMSGARKLVHSDHAAAIRGAYEDLSGRWAPESRTAKQVRDHARARGWAPPAGWETEWLDLSVEELDEELNRLVDRMGRGERKRWWRAVQGGELSPVALVAARRLHERSAREMSEVEMAEAA